VLSGSEWEAKASQDPDLTAATEAIGEQRWHAAVESLDRYVARRPWDDDAHTLLGYAYRKLGAFERSLEHYERALTLNPYHLGAMEYMGEAFMEMGHPERAREMLNRIETTCRRSFPEARWREECHEWQELSERLQAPTGNASPTPGG
jgi:tetratricopeptide (TPR) repeat protein